MPKTKLNPDHSLNELQRLAAALVDIDPDKYGSNDLKAMVDDAGLLAKQVLVLDDHISRGGALPKQWQKATPK